MLGWTDRSGGCEAGDIIITSVLDGFLIGRALGRAGWAYIERVDDRPTAIRVATRRAADAGTRVWLHDGTTYSLLPEHEPAAPTTPDAEHRLVQLFDKRLRT
jgi:hypothetical protein